MNNQRILWFQDGVKFTTPISKWGRIDALTQNLINAVGNRDFDHVVIDPIFCAQKLFQQINLQDYSCIIDLSGFFGEIIKRTFPQVSIANNFRLSRMRMVSSPRLDGSGFLISLNKQQVKNLKDNIDLSKPLFLDDVAWSGRTIAEATRLLGINPELLTVGLLAANMGTFGEGKPGASQILKEEGIRVVTGNEILTPQDDGFHLSDFIGFDVNENVFDDLLRIWTIKEEMQNLSGEARRNAENEIRTLLLANKTALFPKAISSEEMKALQQEGRLYQYERSS